MVRSIPIVVSASILVGASSVVQAAEAKPATPQEPVGFITGGVIGAFAAGPIGAVVGAGLGTWLGNRVHRAGEAKTAEREAAELMGRQNELIEANRNLSRNNEALNTELGKMSQEIAAVRQAQAEPAILLTGLQGDVLFRTASFELSPEMTAQVQTLAKALADSPSIRVRIDGYADPRGTSADNMQLSEARAHAVRDLMIAGGVKPAALEVNAFGGDQSNAEEGDDDGYALERRVRITVVAPEASNAVAQVENH